MTERISINNVLEKLNTIVDVDKVYPVLDTKRVEKIEDLTTIGLRLDKSQALTLAGYLCLAVSQSWDYIDITGYRKPKKNGLHKVTVTTTK